MSGDGRTNNLAPAAHDEMPSPRSKVSKGEAAFPLLCFSIHFLCIFFLAWISMSQDSCAPAQASPCMVAVIHALPVLRPEWRKAWHCLNPMYFPITSIRSSLSKTQSKRSVLHFNLVGSFMQSRSNNRHHTLHTVIRQLHLRTIQHGTRCTPFSMCSTHS